ncbi:MAG: KpsF/GutQ family sugar-phosphate isomerase [Smithellaceae bacterium]|nr:KpsF/GutQ family sugar-phosphate isomerase [Smithellaceae bacterium]
MSHSETIIQAKEVLRIEAEGIMGLIDKVDENFNKAVELICRSKGRVIITGIGKSGIIGKKIVATLISTGTQAMFLHPVEGLHGDLGIVTREDVILAISNSGETVELNDLLRGIRHTGAPLISFTGNLSSTLARHSDAAIDVGVNREACPFGLAPTSSTTAAMAMGDALAVALIKRKDFRETDFYKFHPGGSLGQRLRAKVKDVMITGEMVPRVFSGGSVIQAIKEIDRQNKGFVLVTDKADHLLGILTDGDLRRLIQQGLFSEKKMIDEVMTRSPKTIPEDLSLAQTVEMMQKDEITTFAVVGEGKVLLGYVHLHDILGRGGTIKISIPV